MNSTAKIISLCIASTVGLCASALALGPVSVTAKADYASKYVWRGYDLYANGDAFQPSLTASVAPMDGLGLSLGAWGSYDVDNNTEWTEFDYTLSGSYAATDKLTVSAGYIYYAFPTVADSDANDTKELYASASFLLPASLAATVSGYYDFDDGKGYYLNCALDYATSLGEKSTLGLGASAGYMAYRDGSVYVDSSGDGFKGISDVNIKASISTPLAEALTLGATANYTIVPDGDINSDNEFWTLTSLTYAF
ncbi:hypothetical protein FDZ71_08210 [bacterium]|nr:MAG: hypothetical protein FDZ71_08210 [bacterium]